MNNNIKVFSNMKMLDKSKVCPRCKSLMWQHSGGMVECISCSLWGWLPDRINYHIFEGSDMGFERRVG